MALLREGKRYPLFKKSNLWTYQWGVVAARCIGLGNKGDNLDYRLRYIYFEFENVASPGDPVTAPTPTRDEGIDYYNDLSASLVRDYLRVPVYVRPELAISAGYEAYIPEDEGNQLVFHGSSTGLATGRHGRTFSAGANSTLFGIAMAAAPVPADPTRDIVYARSYYDTDKQILKLASSEISADYILTYN
jgi:hypothetical protein